MSTREQRLLDPAQIPASLWDAASKALRLPPALARAYQTLIDRYNLANFNAFLVKEEKQRKAEPQLEELLRHASGEKSVAIWMEPDMKLATNLFSWLRKKIKAWWRFAREYLDDNAPVPTSSAQFYLPLTPTKTARVGLAVMPIDLMRSQ